MGARAERAIAIAVVAVRVTFAVQLILAIVHGAGRAEQPGLFVGLGLAMVLESVLLCAFVVRRWAVTRTAAALDLAFVALMILAEPLYSAPEDRVGTWIAWGFGAGAAAALATGVGLPRLREAAGGGGVLVVAYLVASVPAGRQTGTGWTAVTNSVALIGFSLGAWVTARFIRDLAGAADAARAETAELARRAAVERQRLLLHDQATVLSLLSRSGVDGELQAVLRQQALLGSRQIRAFLAREEAPAGVAVDRDGAPVALARVLRAVAEEFGDLPLTVNVDLAAGVRVDGVAAIALGAAVRTLLHNVRRHAGAGAVTLHADRLPEGSWEATVQDDGMGFDPTLTAGFGLRVQAGSALRELGMGVAVQSAPGEGTKVTIIGQPAGDGS